MQDAQVSKSLDPLVLFCILLNCILVVLSDTQILCLEIIFSNVISIIIRILTPFNCFSEYIKVQGQISSTYHQNWPPVKYFTDCSKAVLLLWIFYVFVLSCVCYVFVCVCLYVPCGHLSGKG